MITVAELCWVRHRGEIEVRVGVDMPLSRLDGVGRTVIADSSQQQNAQKTSDSAGSADPPQLGFKALIELRTQALKTGEATFPLAAGMQLSAEIVEGRRTVLEYFLSPVQKVVSEAGMER